MKYCRFFIILFCAFCTVQLYAQNSLNSTGLKISGSSGTINYSVGQITFSNIQITSGSVSQGIQQPYRITTLSNAENGLGKIDLKVFPNPTSNVLNLKLDDLEIEEFSYQLFNIDGVLLESRSIDQKNTTINMNERVSTTYLLKLFNNNEVVKIFRIVKN